MLQHCLWYDCLCHPVTWCVAAASLRNEMIQPVGEALGAPQAMPCFGQSFFPACPGAACSSFMSAPLCACTGSVALRTVNSLTERIILLSGSPSPLLHWLLCTFSLYTSFTGLECHSQHTSHPGDCSQHRWLFVAEYM